MAKGSSDQAKEVEKTGRHILEGGGKAIDSKLSDAAGRHILERGGKAIDSKLSDANKAGRRILKTRRAEFHGFYPWVNEELARRATSEA